MRLVNQQPLGRTLRRQKKRDLEVMWVLAMLDPPEYRSASRLRMVGYCLHSTLRIRLLFEKNYGQTSPEYWFVSYQMERYRQKNTSS